MRLVLKLVFFAKPVLDLLKNRFLVVKLVLFGLVPRHTGSCNHGTSSWTGCLNWFLISSWTDSHAVSLNQNSFTRLKLVQWTKEAVWFMKTITGLVWSSLLNRIMTIRPYLNLSHWNTFVCNQMILWSQSKKWSYGPLWPILIQSRPKSRL